MDHLKHKHIGACLPSGENKIRSPATKISNIETKTLQSKKVLPTSKILNKEINHQLLKTAAKQEFKLLSRISPVNANKLAIHKKKNLAALKNKCSQLANVEEIPSAPKVKRITKVSNIQLPKIIPQEKTATVQKTKPQENITTVQKNIPEVKTIPAENTKHQNDITSIKNKVQENDTCNLSAVTKNNIISAQDIKPQENAPKINLATQNHQKTQKDDKVTMANSIEQQKPAPSQMEVSPKKQLKLDPLLARAVEEELQDIMIQVWQELPDDPMEEEDRLVVDKLRNEAGDDLRRVLGLNITKRLLNVYNNLFVKMQFTCRPQMGCLTSFLNEYHIEKFKRIDKNSNTFAAQMETIDDFDKLCAVKELMCGEAKITITPCYKFSQCPENLKTIYDDTYFYEDTTQAHSESKKRKNNVQEIKVIVSNENVVKPEKKTEDIDAKCNKTESDPKSTDKPEIQNIENSVRKNCEDVEKDSITARKYNTTECSKIITEDLKSKENEVIDINIATNEKEINTKEKDNIEKHEKINLVIKDRLESDGDDDIEAGIPECQIEDDELDDEDILALVSEGVVLDECSGSEDEN